MQHLTQHAIQNNDPAILARLDGVRRCGSGWIARCPAHDDHRASLSIGVGNNSRVLLYCHAGCSYREILEALGNPAANDLRLEGAQAVANQDRSLENRIQAARAICRRAVPLQGTLAQRYLEARGITIASPALRFIAELRHKSGIVAPALVAAVQNVEGHVVAVHRTWLAPDGRGKAELEPNKMGLGRVAGGAVRLAPAAETLALAEGIETALSVMQATRVPTWAVLGATNFARIQLPETIRNLIICADSDAAGEQAAQAAAQRFLRQGLRVRVATAVGRGRDFNDMLVDHE